MINNNKKILIMMTTFNGERFLKKQIDSIINQTYKNWSLIIQDDGSDDETINILNEYLKIDKRIALCKNKNYLHGAYINFHYLIQSCLDTDYDYYMFSDQDDIWDLDKIEKYLLYIKQNVNEALPFLLYGNLRIIDENDFVTKSEIGQSLNYKFSNKYSFFFQGRVNGMCALMNKLLFKSLIDIDFNENVMKSIPHDCYFSVLAATIGNVYYMNEVTASYRRHIDNTSRGFGEHNHNLLLKFYKLLRFPKIYSNKFNDTLYEIKCFKKLCNANLKLLFDIESVIRNGGMNSVTFIISKKDIYREKLDCLFSCITLFFKLQKKYLVY